MRHFIDFGINAQNKQIQIGVKSLAMTTKSGLKLGIDSHYTESEINEMGMTLLNNHKMDCCFFQG